MKKNIIFPIEFNHFTGGMIHSTISIVEYFSEFYDVYILAHKDAEVFKLNLKAKHLILKKKWITNGKSPIKTIITYFEIRKLVNQFDKNNTYVFTNNVGSEIIFSGFGFFPIPYKRIFISRGGDYLGKTGFILRKGFKSVYKFIAVSQRQINVLKESGVTPDQIELIHNGVEIKNWKEYKYSFNKSEKIKISIVGYINSNKNQILAVNALSKLLDKKYNLVLNIYGIAFSISDKIYEKELLTVISNLNLNESIYFKGFEKTPSKIYHNTDILISCSLSEGFGRTIVEGMAFGVPCIGLKDSGGLKDIITNNHDGILISNDLDQLVDSIIKIYDDEIFRANLSFNSRFTYENKFTKNIMCEKYKMFANKYL